MPKPTEAISVRALQLVSLALTVVTITAVATVAYSGYLEVSYLQSGFQAKEPPLRFEPINGQQALVLNITIPNQGLYPLELSVGTAFMYKDNIIASNESSVVTIPPGSSGPLRVILLVRLQDFLKNSELASKLRTGGAPVSITLKVTATVVPFLSVDAKLAIPCTATSDSGLVLACRQPGG